MLAPLVHLMVFRWRCSHLLCTSWSSEATIALCCLLQRALSSRCVACTRRCPRDCKRNSGTLPESTSTTCRAAHLRKHEIETELGKANVCQKQVGSSPPRDLANRRLAEVSCPTRCIRQVAIIGLAYQPLAVITSGYYERWGRDLSFLEVWRQMANYYQTC